MPWSFGQALASPMSPPIEIIRYTSAHQPAWDQFVRDSKNGTFLFYRAYLDYHADRFTDHSLLLYRQGRLAALLPANEKEGTLTSHGGLTYGGLLLPPKTKTSAVLSFFEAVRAYLQEQGFGRLLYKAIPYIYHQVPAQEDLYALFRQGATLLRRDVSSTIDLGRRISYSRNRTENLKKAEKGGISLAKSSDYEGFMRLQQNILREKYGTEPTHTAPEITSLAEKFPENIRLHVATLAGEMVAGTILFESEMVVHAQYIAASETGKKTGGLELLFDHLLREFAGKKRYFDFGISTDKAGTYLNESLIQSKERYGARVVVYDFYELLL